MNILSTNQYNQGLSKSKLLSSTSGVGSIITTKAGYYIIISDINKWRFIIQAQKEIAEVRKEFPESEWYERAKARLHNHGITVVDDPRFIDFIQTEKGLRNLLCLLEIPHLSINEQFGTVNANTNPIIKDLKEKGERVTTEDFMIFGSHFPKWFKNRSGELRLYNDWKDQWRINNLRMKFFAPPRDAKDPVLGANKTPIPPFKVKDIDGVEEEITLFHQLTQINLALICPNGHLSDIPWGKFLKWKSERRSPNDRGDELLSSDDCCPRPKLKWTESTTRSEGYSSIYIECENCKKKENLEGVNNLAPFCIGEKPWELDLENSDLTIPRDSQCNNVQNGRQRMQVALVTGNNVYFSNGFSSLYIPKFLIKGIEEAVESTSEEYEKKYKRYLEFEPAITKEDFFNKIMTLDKLKSDGYHDLFEEIRDFYSKVKKTFLNEAQEEITDSHENFRWQEYRCFKNNSSSSNNLKDFSFNDIDLPSELSPYFSKIQQIDELKICQVQFDFTRVKPNERIRRNGDIINTAEGKNIYSIDESDLYALPTNETFGEGLFFGFNETEIANWFNKNREILTQRLSNLIGNYDENSPGASIRQRITNDGFHGGKFLLIHTFSHILMRELEFSCGYPTASLKERLFISDRMSGVLIYTAEGAEGSMGGLVWQGQPKKIEELIKKAMQRSFDCTSDPLCWESDGHGIFNLNLAACFSCSLVSETACEERNLGLDRRILIDPSFGFFKNLLFKLK